MIKKETGNHKIHRLRVIHIYKADYNLLLCVKWQSTVHHAMKSKTLNPCQKGGTPGNSAPDVVFVEELEYEICRATCTPLGKNDFDASSCYDRIHCFLANLASRKYGVDKQNLHSPRAHFGGSQILSPNQAWCFRRDSFHTVKPIPSTALDKEAGIHQSTCCSFPAPSLIATL